MALLLSGSRDDNTPNSTLNAGIGLNVNAKFMPLNAKWSSFTRVSDKLCENGL